MCQLTIDVSKKIYLPLILSLFSSREYTHFMYHSRSRLQRFISHVSPAIRYSHLQSASKADRAAAFCPPICASLSAICRQLPRHLSASLAPITLRPSPSKTDILHPNFAVSHHSFIMQAVNAESSVGKAPKACKFCRSRKKKCDKALPRCGFCAK